MRPAIVADVRMLAYPMTGIGRYTYELTRRLVRGAAEEWVLLTPQPVPPAIRAEFGEHVIWVQGDRNGRAEHWVQRRSIQELRARPGSVFLGLANSIPFLGPRRTTSALLVYDLTSFEVPSLTHPQDLVKGFLINLPSLMFADRLLAISPSVERALHRWLPWRRQRTVALPPGGTPLAARSTRGWSERRGFVAVGAHPRKNTGLLLQAYARLAEAVRKQHPLHIVARHIPSGIGRHVKELGLEEQVRIDHDATDERLADLYGRSIALVYPSTYEGLGLPVAEALLMGLPAIVPGGSPMEEFLDEAGIVVPSMSAESLATSMLRLATDSALWQKCAGATGSASTHISWDAVAHAVRVGLGL
jgi:glycosyltransferase involved in cell wall biosynthesis